MLFSKGNKRWNEKDITYEVDGSGCWNCTSHALHRYMTIRRDGKGSGIHRYIYTAFREPIKAGNVVRHLCNNTACINPEHLAQGTQKENIADRERAGNTPRGARNGNTIFTEDDIRFIKGKQERGVVYAAMYGVSKGTISAIQHGRNWGHVV